MFRKCVRRLSFVAWAMTALLLGASQAAALGHVLRAPPEPWVKDTIVPAPRPERARQVADGIYYLLSDDQDRPGFPAVSYSRLAYRITDRTGLEQGAGIDLSFDPAVSDLILHHIWVIRDGVAQDRLASADIQLLRREKELDKGVFDGRKTAHIELKDVRAGDVVDYAYSLRTSDPLLRDAYQTDHSTSWSSPVGLTQFRLLWPHGRPIAIRRFAGAPSPTVTPGPDRDEYIWRIVDPDPVEKEEKAPDWIDQWGRVGVSSMTGWADIAAWSLPLYPVNDPLPPAWAAKVDEIAARYRDPRDRITQAIRLVQDDVRYVSMSMGEGGYRPRPAAQVIRSAFGDCKDKAQLLVTVLRRLGVYAVPALADINHARALDQEAPGVNAFDHAIVRIEYGGKVYWADPTHSQEGGRFPARAPLMVGWALPLRPGQTKLEAVSDARPSGVTTDVMERFELPRGAEQDLILTVISTYRDADADSIRADFASKSPAAMERRYLDFYTEVYPGIRRIQPIEVSDQRDANVFVVHESYVIPAKALAKDGLLKAFPIRASALSSYKTPPTGERRLPLWAYFPIHARHQFLFVTPGHRVPAPPALELDNKTFRFKRSFRRDGDTLVVTEIVEGLRELVPAAEVEGFRADVKKFDDASYSDLDLTSTRGGVIGQAYMMVAWIVIGAILLAPTALIIFSVRSALKADAAYADEGQFYPVRQGKYLLMSVLSAGLYPMFWRWKNWRWYARSSGENIFPFWRMVFAVFWMLPLFDLVNRQLAKKRLPNALGAAAAIIFVGLTGASIWLGFHKSAPWWTHWPGYLSFLCDLPTVIAVRRLNSPDSTVVKANSRYTWHSAVAIGVGLLSWLGVILMPK